MTAITRAISPAAVIRSLVCLRQSANAASRVVVAMTEIGNLLSTGAPDASPLGPSIGLLSLYRPVVRSRIKPA